MNDHFKSEVKLLQQEIKDIMNEIAIYNQMKKDKVGEEELVDMIFQITRKYSKIPSIHLSYCELLISRQLRKQNFIEAGIGCVHVISYIYNYLRHTKKINIAVLNMKHLRDIADKFIDYEEPLLTIESDLLTENSLIKYVFDGIDDFNKANLHSFALSLCYFILPYFRAIENYKKLAEIHKKINELYTNMLDVNNRYIGYFYLVSFFNPAPQPMKQYVYRSVLRIKEFQDQLIQVHSKNGLPVTILEAKKQPDPKLKQVKVINVQPFNLETNSPQQGNDFPHTNTFCSEVRMMLDGAKPEVLEKACKDRTILQLKHPFPSMVEREEVVSSEVIRLSPIQSSTDDINSKVEQFSALLERREELRLSALQVLLKGILSAEVNGGPGAICKTFLNKDSLETNRYPVKDVKKLVDVMQKLLDNCKDGLSIHKDKMKAESAGLQNIFELGFLALDRTLKECRDLASEYCKKREEEGDNDI